MNIPDFFVDYETILLRIKKINPSRYAKSRNFLDGEVSYLSPFITHGIISAKKVMDIVQSKHSTKESFKLYSELGWREFFHRVWQAKGTEIFTDLRYDQTKVSETNLPTSVLEAKTGIMAIDQTIEQLKKTGYMHNHARMWLASLVCNVAETRWNQPARWLHYHLLDGDLASNTLSWQWIAGTFSHKKYYANQENLNKYSGKQQTHTFLDVPYESFETMAIPDILQTRSVPDLSNQFPESTAAPIEAGETILLHSIWNLDPTWRSTEKGRRILWINPKTHTDWPLSPLRWEFITHWAQQIEGLEIFVGDAATLFQGNAADATVYSREHPLTQNWPGKKDVREWCFPNTSGYFKNFFSFWKQAQKELPNT